VALYLLLDGHSLAFRAWFALQETQMTTASGQHTAAIYGFTGMLARLLEDHSPAGMAVAFDRPEPTFRDAMADDYKAGRAPTPEPLREQIDLIRRTVETMGIPVVEVPGFEADDVLATLATRLEAEGDDVVIVTGDRDSYQLVHDPHVRVLYNRRGVTDYVLYDEAGIAERTGVTPDRYPFLAALRGDPSDNLPGVPGVGEKTAAKLVNTYGDIDTLFAHLDEQTPKLRQALAENEARVRLNFSLTPLVRDVEFDCDLSALRFGGSDREALNGLFNLLEIKAPRDRLLKALDRLESVAPAPAVDTDARRAPVADRVAITVLAEPGTAAAILEALAEGDGPIAVEPEWAGAPGRSAIIGLALAAVSGEPGETTQPSDSGERVLAVAWLPGEQIAEPSVSAVLEQIVGLPPGQEVGRLVAHRSKELMRALEPMGIPVTGLDLDTAVAGYLADPRVGQATLERLAESAPSLGSDAVGGAGRVVAGEQLGFDVMSDGSADEAIDEGGPGPAARAAAGRLALLVGVEGLLRRALVDAGAERLYADIERPLVRVLAKMELAGIAVDVAKLEAISAELTDEAARLESEVHGLAGEEFNVNSTAQLRRILFDQLGLAPSKRTKTGFSTDAQSLEKLRGQHPIIDTLLTYREVEKLRSTYGTGLLSEVAPDGRIHASFNQTVARTGRLSSDQPNLHNIPVRSMLGRRFRQAFIPSPGSELLVADYDQIELRVIAHLAQDPGLIEAFRTGVDIHEATASRIFGVEPVAVTVAMRSRAKMVSYGLAYGMEAYGLSQRLTIPVEEAAVILEQYFKAFPNVKEYMARTVAEARARGYTETLFGRRRYLPELGTSNFRVRQAAERQAMNAGIQGLAADIFKVALVRLDHALDERGLRSRVVLQVHDEVLVESLHEEAEEVAPLTLEVMTGAAELSVPLAVHVARGESWADAKDDGPAAGGLDDEIDLDLVDALAEEY
jgi:DNA polymerase-1